jgi:hypothetical protein
VEGKYRDLIEYTIPSFASSDPEETSKLSVWIADLRAEIWTHDLPNTK